jgi:hypothetical protein
MGISAIILGDCLTGADPILFLPLYETVVDIEGPTHQAFAIFILRAGIEQQIDAHRIVVPLGAGEIGKIIFTEAFSEANRVGNGVQVSGQLFTRLDPLSSDQGAPQILDPESARQFPSLHFDHSRMLAGHREMGEVLTLSETNRETASGDILHGKILRQMFGMELARGDVKPG